MTKLQKVGVMLTLVAGAVLPMATHAAADASLVNAATDLSSTVKDNVLGTIFSTAFLTVLAVIAVAFGIIAFVTRFLRRHTGR